MSSTLIKQLEPRGWGDLNVETFEAWWLRVRPLIPNWPSEVAEQWLHKHFRDAETEYGWLGWEHLRFRKATWETRDYLTRVRTPKLDMVDQWGVQILSEESRRKVPLQSLIWENGTWPTPPILMENPERISHPAGWPLGYPVHLVEGHLRTGYLRCLAEHHPDRLVPRHNVWLIDRA